MIRALTQVITINSHIFLTEFIPLGSEKLYNIIYSVYTQLYISTVYRYIVVHRRNILRYIILTLPAKTIDHINRKADIYLKAW